MNLSHFFEHWRIEENPFRGEEARHDNVFARMANLDLSAAAKARGAEHSDFEKILGDLGRPSTSIVFGEKGSGKTAIRLQLGSAIRSHNERHPDRKSFLIDYDDLNSVLDRFHAAVGGDVDEALASLRLVDHIDALLATAVTRITSAAVTPGSVESDLSARRLRRLDVASRRTLLQLQAIYDRGDRPEERTPRLRRAIGLAPYWRRLGRLALMALGWAPTAACLYFWAFGGLQGFRSDVVLWLMIGWGAAYLLLLGKLLVWDRFKLRGLGGRLVRQLRTLGRSERSYADALAWLEPSLREPASLPVTDSDDQRYEMLTRLRGVLAGLGYKGVIVLVDRVDEPTLISGAPDRMRAVVWPILNNKFLQLEDFGLKLLLPIELRHALFKESTAFFQEARLDKQNLVERLSWTGAMLYDVCDARLQACRQSGVEPISLLDLFAEDVTRQDLVDALDHMHQPRDAFKFLYQCLTEHCSNVTADQESFRVPRLVLEQVRKRESERLQQLYRGIRPA